MPQPVDLASTVLVALVDIEEVILMSMQIKSVNINGSNHNGPYCWMNHGKFDQLHSVAGGTSKPMHILTTASHNFLGLKLQWHCLDQKTIQTLRKYTRYSRRAPNIRDIFSYDLQDDILTKLLARASFQIQDLFLYYYARLGVLLQFYIVSP